MRRTLLDEHPPFESLPGERSRPFVDERIGHDWRGGPHIRIPTRRAFPELTRDQSAEKGLLVGCKNSIGRKSCRIGVVQVRLPQPVELAAAPRLSFIAPRMMSALDRFMASTSATAAEADRLSSA